jgi:hypothetical protein
MSDIQEFGLVKFDPILSMRDWLKIKQQAVSEGTESHMQPHWWRGQLIGIMFDDAALAAIFKLSTEHSTK